jgi:hypothetical protein
LASCLHRFWGTGAHTACRLLVALVQADDPPALGGSEAAAAGKAQLPPSALAKWECVAAAILVFMATDLGSPSPTFVPPLACMLARTWPPLAPTQSRTCLPYLYTLCAAGAAAFEKDEERRPVLKILSDAPAGGFAFVSRATGAQVGLRKQTLKKFVAGAFPGPAGETAGSLTYCQVEEYVNEFLYNWLKSVAEDLDGTTRECDFWVRVYVPEPVGPYVTMNVTLWQPQSRCWIVPALQP